MQTKSVWEYISFGIDIGVFQVVRLFKIRGLDEAPTTIEVPETEDLIAELENLDLLGARGLMRALDGPMGEWLNNEFLEALRPVLESESDRIQVFTLSPARMDPKKLINDVPSLFPPRVYNSLHEVAQYDFSEAGKCIAFGLPTAAAFHLLRGTEMVLRHLYMKVSGKDASKKYWKTIVDELSATESVLFEPLYPRLDYIRDKYRNPTQHPDKIYDIDEAQDLFGVCIDVVDQMVMLIWKQETMAL